MTVRLPAVAVAVAVAPPMAAAMAVGVERLLLCAPTKATKAMAVPVHQRRPPFVRRQQPLWWKKWLLNRLWRKLLLLSNRRLSQRCRQAVPVVVAPRPAERLKAL